MSSILERFSLKGKVALLTGGAGLYGRQITEALAEAGATTCIASRNLEKLQETAAAFNNVHPFAMDLEKEESIRKTVAQIIERFGKIDILVNNAVTRCACSSWELSMEDFDKSLHVNASSLFLITRLCAADMQKRSSGSIINIGSYMGMRGMNMTNYAGTGMYNSGKWPSPIYFYEKGGMKNFTRFAASILGPDGIRVNCISPGGFQTPDHHERFVKQYSANTFLGRLANSTDLQGAVIFLASEASAYITGIDLPVDGGYTAK
jgi:NAD(P)-dependent dehydrogenase (short-subunit alcohol dehydrogenase family)